jgi:NAD(P)H-dependent flavin oxidoreductase YrpB (nitropropane dioxygenase family)
LTYYNRLLSAGFDDNVRTLIYTGRPLRVRRTPYVTDWEENRQQEIKELTSKGIIPYNHELETHPEKFVAGRTWLMGKVSAVIHVSLSSFRFDELGATEVDDAIGRVG